MLQPKVIKCYPVGKMSLYKSVELWRFRGQYFKAYTTTDGYLNLYFADKDGNTGVLIVSAWDYNNREQAIKWLNANVQ